DYVARNSARASTAKQAQSRQKALAKMQPIAEAVTDPSLIFNFPSPQPLKPPLVMIEHASVGYNETPVLEQIDLRLDPDDRLALLGRNGNGKTTLARLLSGQLKAMAGHVAAPGKLRVGYFTQYQVEELDSDDTPLEHMSRLMRGSNPSAVRAQLGRFGFSGGMAEQKVGKMSGGEKARLALALITRDAPHLLILDEPTNHLDVDTREALVQALNEYEGAVVIVSHDRHMIEASADRLVLVDAGRAVEYDGSMEDYTDSILGKSPPTPEGSKGAPRGNKKDDRKAAAAAREATASFRKAVKDAETETARLTARIGEIDRALFDPKTANASDVHRPASDLMRLRGEAEKALAASEAKWLTASEALEAAVAA
ncbi:MAG: ABC-F family ATP-binding cassette domain-containing protein, partial [Sandarakinorhabdus sp.]|nr:ABC-F family ATP-binding cassette domain-containing protein [Sandarakinorhabdus sp.]